MELYLHLVHEFLILCGERHIEAVLPDERRFSSSSLFPISSSSSAVRSNRDCYLMREGFPPPASFT
jgi:hypothetical protein